MALQGNSRLSRQRSQFPPGAKPTAAYRTRTDNPRAGSWVFYFPVVPLLLLGACARPPVALDTGRFEEIGVQQAREAGYVGRPVRWGGVIVKVEPGKDKTCFEVVQRPLNARARPRRTDKSDGRFLACAAGFYDPAVYAEGRELTVTGVIEKPTAGKIGEYEYRYARVAAEQIYLWPRRAARRAYDYAPGWGAWYPYYYEPWPRYYGPWPYYYPWYPYW